MKPESEIKGSWRSVIGGYIYLAAEDFDKGEGYVLTIKDISWQDVRDLVETKKQKKDVFTRELTASFEETDRLLTLKPAKLRQITTIAGTNKPSAWKGLKIYLHRVEKVYFGKPGGLEIAEVKAAG